MMISNLLKLLPVLALMFMMNVPNALAGGTNRDGNTAAQPGDKATTTKEVTDPEVERRKGTNNPDKMKKPQTEQDMDSGTSGTGTGGSSTGGADSGAGGTGTDSSGGRY
ncbi:MAG: hypothetical protein Q8J65_00185 [Nitrosomonadales bacterium]|nr:hypothetical protein [Nitrosomonadales bacterium]